MKKQTLENIRAKAIQSILDFMASVHMTTLFASDINEGSSPIVQEDNTDDNNTMTLDSVSINEKGRLVFSASNCWTNADFNENNISTDALLNIANWIKENGDDYEPKEEEKKKTVKMKASYDVTFVPMTNVTIEVADPLHPTEEEEERIIKLAVTKIFRGNEDDCQRSEDVACIELYQTGDPLRPQEEGKVTIWP